MKAKDIIAKIQARDIAQVAETLRQVSGFEGAIIGAGLNGECNMLCKLMGVMKDAEDMPDPEAP